MTITRAEVMRRATSLWGGLGQTPYSQDVIKDGYRTDCSGYVSGCWGLTADVGHDFWGGLNTVTLVSSGIMGEIDPNDLLPGDACGNCGPGTEGDSGHVVLFAGWDNDNPDDNHYHCYEQVGGTNGPVYSHYDWPYPGETNWKAYRYVNIVDALPTLKGGDVQFIRLKGFKAVWATDLVTRSWIRTDAGLTAAQNAAKATYGLTAAKVAVQDVDDLDGYGAAVGPLPPDEPSA